MEGPIRGYLFESEIRQNGDTLDSVAYACLAIEGEMALRIGENGQVEAAFPVIELHHFVFRAARKTLVELVANNGLNAGIVQPEEKWLSSRTHLVRAATLSVRRNGHQLGSGELWPLAGGPGASVDWLRQHLAGLGFGLLPGQIVLAGTPLGLYRVEARDQIAIFIDDEQAAHCSID